MSQSDRTGKFSTVRQIPEPLLTPGQVSAFLTRSLLMLPAIGVVVLGLAYALGSAYKLSQLQYAGLNFDDVFPRIPLQEILSEGIGVETTERGTRSRALRPVPLGAAI